LVHCSTTVTEEFEKKCLANMVNKREWLAERLMVYFPNSIESFLSMQNWLTILLHPVTGRRVILIPKKLQANSNSLNQDVKVSRMHHFAWIAVTIAYCVPVFVSRIIRAQSD
jgi:hypothetical protein